MQKHLILKKCTAAVCAAALTGSALSAVPFTTASAASKTLVVLGDSISAGYGLKDGEYGYDTYVAECLNSSIQNYAVSGITTDDLITMLDQPEISEAVSKADFISISIGGNDLLKPAQEYLSTMQKEGETLIDTLRREAKEGDAQTLMVGLTRALTPARSAAKANYPQIESKIRALNPDAPLVMQTLYNPFEVSDQFFQEHKYSEKTIENYKTLMTYVNNTVNFLNKVIRGLEQTDCADVYADFAGAGWMYDRIYEKDVHPTVLGHALIAASVLSAANVSNQKSAKLGSTLDNMLIADYKQIPSADLTAIRKYAASNSYMRGDTDGDSTVTSTDAQALLEIFLATVVGEPLEANITTRQMSVSDINSDSEINAMDAQYILSYFLRNDVLNDPCTWDDVLAE